CRYRFGASSRSRRSGKSLPRCFKNIGLLVTRNRLALFPAHVSHVVVRSSLRHNSPKSISELPFRTRCPGSHVSGRREWHEDHRQFSEAGERLGLGKTKV